MVRKPSYKGGLKMNYRMIKLNDKKALLREDEVRLLIKRYDPNDGHEGCILCKRYPTCTGCPVNVFRNKPLVGCEVLTFHVLGKEEYPEPVARYKYKHRGDALKLKKWFESLPTKEVNDEV